MILFVHSWHQNSIFEIQMIPDYAHKIFGDKRINYILLMVTLAMDSARS